MPQTSPADAVDEGASAASPRLSCRLLELQDERWGEFLASVRHDIYHTRGYLEASASHEGGRPCALVIEGPDNALFQPLVLRRVEGGGLDASSPYGYAGPLVLNDRDDGFVADAMVSAVEFLRREGSISLFVRSHPILSPRLPPAVGRVVEHGAIVVVDTAQPRELLWSQIRRSHRRDIRRVRDARVEAVITDEPRAFAEFTRLYRDTMARIGADPFYLFDESYFNVLRERLPGQLLVALATRKGRSIAAGLYTLSDGIVQAHLSGTEHRFGSATCPATKLLDWSVIEWAHEHACAWLSLGGGRGGTTDSLYQYKAGFSALRRPYHTLRVVLDPDAYQRLTAAHRPGADWRDLGAFFPRYRERDPGRTPTPRTRATRRASGAGSSRAT